MQKISPGQFINAWMNVVEGNESWMNEESIIESVAIELNVTEEFVKRLVKTWQDSDRKLPGID